MNIKKILNSHTLNYAHKEPTKIKEVQFIVACVSKMVSVMEVIYQYTLKKE